ncbi:MAG: hypothetical protein HOI23_09060 [Deltaproteobacteria bacterium]|jgi:hypothetical protein|nr:hypothetical protein [Deltaproteobacteria bacterium]MBT6436101.1 hypothetical protein [Deltaproteobacteria bacterium]
MAVKFFGQFLIQKGEISVDQLREALDLMESRNRSFCDMAVEKGLLTVEQSETLKSLESNTPTTASQAAAEEGFLTTEQVSDVLKAQQGARIRIGEALVELTFVEQAQLPQLLEAFHADQADYQIGKVKLPSAFQKNLMAEYVVDFFPKFVEKISKIKLKVYDDSHGATAHLELVSSLVVFGRYSLRVCLSSDESFARGLLAGIAASIPNPDRETLQGVLGEFLNIVVGNAVAALERHDCEAELDTPIFGQFPEADYRFQITSTVGQATLGLELLN